MKNNGYELEIRAACREAELVVTGDPSLVTLLREHGLPETTPILTQAGEDDVRGKRVLGTLSFSLATVTNSVTEIVVNNDEVVAVTRYRVTSSPVHIDWRDCGDCAAYHAGGYSCSYHGDGPMTTTFPIFSDRAIAELRANGLQVRPGDGHRVTSPEWARQCLEAITRRMMTPTEADGPRVMYGECACGDGHEMVSCPNA